MLHEIINFSDKYFVEEEDLAVLTATIFLLGKGTLETSSSETDYCVPSTAFGGMNGVDFFLEEFKSDLNTFIIENKEKISNCFFKVKVGSAEDRKEYFETLSTLENIEEQEKFVNDYLNTHQTSFNPIGQRAFALYKALKK